MAFSTTLQSKDSVSVITVNGELDGSSAPEFREKVDQAFSPGIKRLVLQMGGLEYMASAGVRVLVYAKQKVGVDVEIYVVAPQEQVLDTLRKTGADRGVVIVDEYDEAA
jgi:anti-anti-sigma factor